jgi:hypothetical protein
MFLVQLSQSDARLPFFSGSSVVKVPFDMSTVYTYTYTTDGTYNVVANLSNKVSTGVLLAPISVAVPVINMVWVMPVAHASINERFVAGITMDSGKGVLLVWNFGDGSPDVVKSRTGEHL